MTATPRTTDLARGNHVVPVEFARDLERELLEARALAEDLLEKNAKQAVHIDQWREVAGMLAACPASSSVHPSAYHFRGTALEAYERLKNNGAGIEL
jgi:transposase